MSCLVRGAQRLPDRANLATGRFGGADGSAVQDHSVAEAGPFRLRHETQKVLLDLIPVLMAG